jgi:hypothetical protein
MEWWTSHRHHFTLYVSELVWFEASRGNPDAAQARLSLVADLPVIKIDDAARSLAQHILKATALPEKAAADALHLALSAINGMDFLVTWNCTHLANAVVLRSVNAVCRDHGYEPPIVCTPEELMTHDDA